MDENLVICMCMYTCACYFDQFYNLFNIRRDLRHYIYVYDIADDPKSVTVSIKEYRRKK